MLVLSGCTTKEPAAPEPETTPTTGTIRGSAVTPLIQPIAGASIRIEPGKMMEEPNLGWFQFDFLPPGAYRVVAEAGGYTAGESAVTVVAGETTRPGLVLTPITAPMACHVTSSFEGHANGSIGPADQASEPAKQAAGIDGCVCTSPVEMMPGTVSILVEATWQDAVPPAQPSACQWLISVNNGNTTTGGRHGSTSRGVSFRCRTKFTGASAFEMTLIPEEPWPT